MGKTNIWLQLREAAGAVDDNWLRAYLFAHLGRIWPQAGERIYWPDALTALEQVADENNRTLLLARIAPHLPEALHDRACELIERIRWPRNRTSLLIAYAPFLSADHKGNVLSELLDTLLNQSAGPDTATQLDTLIPLLSETQRLTSVETIQTQPGLWNQAQKIRPFLPFLSTKDRQNIVSQLIFRCRRLETSEKYRVMAEVAPYLPEPKLRELVDSFRELDNDTSRMTVLERIVEALPEAQMPWVWDGIQSVWNKNRRTWLMCRLYYWLPSNRQPAALSEVRNTLQISVERDKLLLDIHKDVPHILLHEMLEMAAKAPEPPQLELFDGLLTRLPASLLAEGLEITLDIGRSGLDYRRLEVLNRLAERLSRWAEEVPESAQTTWQWLFSRRKASIVLDENPEAEQSVSEAAVSRTEFLIDMIGLLPFFLHFVPKNHQPAVAIQLIDEMRQRITGPKLIMHGRQPQDLPQHENGSNPQPVRIAP